MKALLALVFALGLLSVSTWGLSGEGPVWSHYVGAGTVFVFLLLILQQVSNIPTTTEIRKLLGISAAQQQQSAKEVDDELDAPEARSPRMRRN